MSWDHFDMMSITPDPVIPAGSWQYSEVGIENYYTVYYPGDYKYDGRYEIPNNVDLPGTLSNNQMVYCHTTHDFVDDKENWIHMELDEFPDPVRLEGVSITDFYACDGTVPTHRNFDDIIHYYRPIFTAIARTLRHQH